MSLAIGRLLRVVTLSSASILAAGCMSSYVVPGGPADLSALAGDGRSVDPNHIADPDNLAPADPQPMAHFPAMVAIARVQASGYRSYSASSYGRGAYSVVTTRDVESDDAFGRVMRLPGIQGLAQLNRLTLPQDLQSEVQLRQAARRLKADVLVLYTFDTDFYDRDYAQPLSVVTLGLSPNKRAFVTTTATALITDARTGYIYGGAETTEKSDQIANAWTTDDAVDDARRRTESRAFEKLVGEMEKTWPTIVARYSQPTTAPVASR